MDRRSALKLIAGASVGMAAAPLASARTPSLDQPPNFVPADISPRRIIRQVVGLRPFRPAGYVVRAERFSRRKTLVHHYGHGGAGVTMSWGTAAQAERALLSASNERTVGRAGVRGNRSDDRAAITPPGHGCDHLCAGPAAPYHLQYRRRRLGTVQPLPARSGR